jgi:spore photoproduct lyase
MRFLYIPITKSDIMQYTIEGFTNKVDPMAVSSFSITEAIEKAELEPEGFSIRARNGAPFSLKIENVLNIKGNIQHRITAVGDGSIIKLFDKTPYPVNDNDVVCPHFIELKWANGCKFDCSWCYLNGTMRFRPMGKAPYLKDKNKIIAHLQEYLETEKDPTVLNSGELSDSLVYEGNGFSLTRDIIPLFKQQKRHKLLILTKSAAVKGLLESESQKNIIVSFSLNALPVAKKWEKKAPSPTYRIKSAKKLADAGYKVRIRIDPMVPINNWERWYEELVDLIYSNLKPQRVTFGTLRGLQSTINNCKDKSWVKYLNDRSNWGLKAPDNIRFNMYSRLMDKVKEYDNRCQIAMCKETVGMWKEMHLDYRKIKCNCIL